MVESSGVQLGHLHTKSFIVKSVTERKGSPYIVCHGGSHVVWTRNRYHTEPTLRVQKGIKTPVLLRYIRLETKIVDVVAPCRFLRLPEPFLISIVHILRFVSRSVDHPQIILQDYNNCVTFPIIYLIDLDHEYRSTHEILCKESKRSIETVDLGRKYIAVSRRTIVSGVLINEEITFWSMFGPWSVTQVWDTEVLPF